MKKCKEIHNNEYSFNNISVEHNDIYNTYFYLRKILEAIIADREILKHKPSYSEILKIFVRKTLNDGYNDYLYDEDTNENYKNFLKNMKKVKEEDNYQSCNSNDIYILFMNAIREILKFIN